MAKIAIIGSGFSGLSAACYLSEYGHEVHVFEQNNDLGGRARQFSTENRYVFDMGPSWYWMPDIFDTFFQDFGYKTSDFYSLKLLDPSFDIVYGKDDILSIPANFEELCALFESLEPGSAARLVKFLDEAAFKYQKGVDSLMYMPGLSIKEFADVDLIKNALKLQVFKSLSHHVRQYFDNPKLIALMEFPVLFLGAMPQDTPALYSLMNYAALKLGTWYPMGGFGKVVDAMVTIAKKNKVTFHQNTVVEKIMVSHGTAKEIMVNGEVFTCDGVIGSADYHHIERDLLEPQYRNYNESYWKSKTFAPSCLIFYLGINKKIDALHHHTLFFDHDLSHHAREIYKDPKWPTKPLFYACCTSRTDDAVAPKGHENLFLLMPIAPGLEDKDEMREKYFQMMIKRLENHLNEPILEHVDFMRSYCVDDFITDYNSYKGNAYGLANTLMQTAIFKPKLKNKKVKNLFYAGQLTVPGPGVPPSIISGKIAAQQLNNYLNNTK